MDKLMQSSFHLPKEQLSIISMSYALVNSNTVRVGWGGVWVLNTLGEQRRSCSCHPTELGHTCIGMDQKNIAPYPYVRAVTVSC
jgi:hypothetical protein